MAESVGARRAAILPAGETRSVADRAAAITKAASKQTYYTVRFLVDRRLVADAYCAYGYFRWVDDRLDGGSGASAPDADAARDERLAFLARQQALAEACLRGEQPDVVDPHELMLVELFRHSGPADTGLRSYVQQMMLVMAFDVGRRGRLITREELDEYTRWLATAVTDAMHNFIGHAASRSADADRYRAVTGAHILHMLRDTDVDLQAGYFNVPLEVLDAASIGPRDVACPAYRRWVQERVRQADGDLRAGERYFAGLRSRRHRLAGLAYVERFRWLVEQLERDDYRVRPTYAGQMSRGAVVRAAWSVAAAMAGHPRTHTPRGPPRRRIGGRA
jgi:hypothetical protein